MLSPTTGSSSMVRGSLVILTSLVLLTSLVFLTSRVFLFRLLRTLVHPYHQIRWLKMYDPLH